MEIVWSNRAPIYLQLRDRLAELILDGQVGDGEALPSMRRISSEQRINPLTVAKAYQVLVDENLVEKRRGLGMYVVSGARERLARREKARFIRDEWPRLARRMERLGINPRDLAGAPPRHQDGRCGK